MPKKHQRHKAAGGFSVCEAKMPHTSALSGGENEESCAAAAALRNGFPALFANSGPKGRAAFGPLGKGCRFLCLCQGQAAAGGEIVISSAISALTPRRNHNILWLLR